jgi:hypothetical protein
MGTMASYSAEAALLWHGRFLNKSPPPFPRKKDVEAGARLRQSGASNVPPKI